MEKSVANQTIRGACAILRPYMINGGCVFLFSLLLPQKYTLQKYVFYEMFTAPSCWLMLGMQSAPYLQELCAIRNLFKHMQIVFSGYCAMWSFLHLPPYPSASPRHCRIDTGWSGAQWTDEESTWQQWSDGWVARSRKGSANHITVGALCHQSAFQTRPD